MKNLIKHHRLGGHLLFLLIIAILFSVNLIPAVRAAEHNPDQAQAQVELTVYNENLALVKERRTLNLANGRVSVNFAEVAALIDPTRLSSAP